MKKSADRQLDEIATDSEICPLLAGQLFARATPVKVEKEPDEDSAEFMGLEDASEIYRAALETERRAAARLAQAQKAYLDAQTLADEASELVLQIAERKRKK